MIHLLASMSIVAPITSTPCHASAMALKEPRDTAIAASVRATVALTPEEVRCDMSRVMDAKDAAKEEATGPESHPPAVRISANATTAMPLVPLKTENRGHRFQVFARGGALAGIGVGPAG